jgi:drug/metabolite transporter (DMT)-like permease
MDSERLGIVFGLASALSWGAGDFSGGLAAKRSPAYAVVIASQLVGLLLLGGLAVLIAEPLPAPTDLLWSAVAGIAGGIGLVALYRGLATGRMGVVAPVTAVMSAAVPVLFGAFVEGLPTWPQLLGFGLALVAVWLVSWTGKETGIRGRDLGLPLLAGVGFGVFLVVIDHVSDTAILWPLVAARTAAIAMLSIVTVRMRSTRMLVRRQLPLAALAGLLDSGGNAFYALAAQAGRLDMAAVLSSLYPAGTVLLARLVLKESVSRPQWLGVATALVAIVLITS